MAWTTPMTAVANSPMTAALYNAQIRDNMRQQAPYATGSAGDIFVTTGVNSLTSRTIEYDQVTASQTTTSADYVDLATVGPTVTIAKVYGGSAMVWITAELDNGTANSQAVTAVEVSGATTIAPGSTRACQIRDGLVASNPVQSSACYLFTGLSSAGSITFTMKYRNGDGASTVTAKNRRMMVWAL